MNTSTKSVSENRPPLFHEITVKLSGDDGNAFSIMAKVIKALKKGGHGDRCDEFLNEAMAGDYNDLLVTCMKWVNVT